MDNLVNNLNPYAISGLLIIFAYFPAFLLIFIKGKTFVARIFALDLLAMFTWGVGSFLYATNHNIEFTYIAAKIGYVGVIFIPVFFCHTVLLITKTRSKIILFLIYLQAIFFTYTLWSNKMVASLQLLFNSYYFPNNSVYLTLSFVSWIVIIVYSHYKLLWFYKFSNVPNKKQFLFFFLGIISFIGGVGNYLPIFGIMVYPYGNFLVPFFSPIVFYALFHDQLLDVKIVIKKGMVYSILLFLITLIYLIIVVFSEKLLAILFGYQSIILAVTFAFMIGVIFFPMHNKVQVIVNKILFQGSPVELAERNELLLQEVSEKDKFKTVSTLASGIAHEIKNPLTAIQTFSEYLPQKLDDKEFLTKFSKIVSKEVNRIDDLVHQLLEYAKPAPLQLKPTDMQKLLSETLELLSNDFLRHKIGVIRNFPVGRHITLNVDPNKFRQALLNLFLNSLDAMPDGGELTVGIKSSLVKREAYLAEQESTPLTPNPNPFNPSLSNPNPSNPQTLVISITDTGKGISPQDLPHIFDPFFSKKDKGTGLGLSITQNIISDHGGKIGVKSEVGKGATFTLEFPFDAD